MDVILANSSYILRGLELTLILSSVSLVGSFIVGTTLALLRMSAWWWLRWPAILYIDTLRMIPLIMVIFWVFFLIPILTGDAVAPITAVLIALIGFTASYMAEIVRAGIQTVPSGLIEAARSSGLTYVHCMSRIVLPLALKNILPALVGRFVSLIIATSLAYVVGATELFRAVNDINNRVFRPYELYMFVGAVYFILCYALSGAGRALERHLGRGQRPISGERVTSV